MEEQREDLTIIGKPTIQNEDAKFYKDVYVFGKLYYDFDGDDNEFGDLNSDSILNVLDIVSLVNMILGAGN